MAALLTDAGNHASGTQYEITLADSADAGRAANLGRIVAWLRRPTGALAWTPHNFIK